MLDGGYITPDGRLMAVAGGKLVVCNCDDGRCQSLCPVPPRAWMVLDSFRVLGCSRDRGVVALADGMGMGLLLLDTASGRDTHGRSPRGVRWARLRVVLRRFRFPPASGC